MDTLTPPADSLASFIRRRLLVGLLTLLGVATAVFLLIHLLPGDPAETMLARSCASPEAVDRLRADLGLDHPLWLQYGRWLGNLASGNLGRSLLTGRPVSRLIAEQFPFTLTLALAGFLLALVIGLGLALVAATWPHSLIDRAAMAFAIGGLAIPIFWSGLLLIWLFSVRLGWLPAGGTAGLGSLVMPAVVLGYATAGPLARLGRVTLLDVLGQPFITTARAKGLGRWRVLSRHAARNAVVPLLTLAGVQLGFLLGGTVVTETLFSRPGLGRLLVDGILWRDLPLVQGVALFIAGLYVMINLIVDVLAGVIDPRLGHG